MMLRENGICMDIENLPLANPSENDDSAIVADGCALVISEMKEREEEEANRKKHSLVDRNLGTNSAPGSRLLNQEETLSGLTVSSTRSPDSLGSTKLQ
jgi:hypothetical protein